MHGRNEGETSASEIAPNKAPIGVDRTTATIPSLQRAGEPRPEERAYIFRLDEAFPVTNVLRTNPGAGESQVDSCK
jgi:hypothetical protein